MKETLLGLGGMQMLVGTLSGGALAWFLGIPWQAALIVGGLWRCRQPPSPLNSLMTNSSYTLHTALGTGYPAVSGSGSRAFPGNDSYFSRKGTRGGGLPLLYALAKGITALTVMLGLGRWVLRPLFHE